MGLRGAESACGTKNRCFVKEPCVRASPTRGCVADIRATQNISPFGKRSMRSRELQAAPISTRRSRAAAPKKR
eukprot:3394090-Pleurochrysis_carterae.AAC.1